MNSILNKMNFIFNLLNSWSVDVLSVCETWLVRSCSSSYVSVPGYRVFRGDVFGTIKKHGTAIFIKDSLCPVAVEVFLPNVSIVYLNKFELFVISIYRPPSYSEEENNSLKAFLLDFCTSKNVIMMGDFNLPSLRWDADVPTAGYVPPLDMAFFEVFSLLGITQWVREATFISSDNVLDLIFTSECDSVIDVFSLPPLPGCHHVPVIMDYCTTLCAPIPVLDHRENVLWYKGHYNLICENLDLVDWCAEFSSRTLGDCWRYFADCIDNLVNRFVPRGSFGCGYRRMWKPPGSLMRERAVAWSYYKSLRKDHGRNNELTMEALDIYKEINYRYRNFAFHKQCDYEERLVSQLSSAPKLFHGYIRSKKKGRPPVGPLKLNGLVICEPSEMAEVFVQSFAEVFQPSRARDPRAHQEFLGSLGYPDTSYTVVLDVLKGLDGSSAPGPDGIHPYLLKNCAQSVAYPLSLLYARVVREGSVPADWKLSHVVPIIKSGSRAEPLNYRPVSLTSVPCKVFERVITQHLLEYLESNNILSPNQFGFRSGRGTEDQLLIAYNDVTKLVDSGRSVTMAFLDFSKAFDVVCHSLLLQKLRCLGVGDGLLRLLESFLVGRFMAVAVDGCVSSMREVTSGVPQGSVVGPVLFLVYVNHVMKDVGCKWVAFADDFKLWCVRDDPSLDASGDCLQSDLSRIDAVSRSWNLKLNAAKSVIMQFGPGLVRRNFFIGGDHLEHVTSYKDLGVIIDTSLRFHVHARTVAAKAGGLAGELLRSTVCRSPSFMVSLFVSHVRPIIEYCSCVWNTGYLADIRLLESIQRRWTAEIAGLRGLDYGARLRELCLYSVYGRLLRRDMVMVWKIVNFGCDSSIQMFEFSQEHRTRGHNFKLVIPRCSRDMRRRWFSARTINRWNSLPTSVVNCTTIGSFKVALDRALGDLLYWFA